VDLRLAAAIYGAGLLTGIVTFVIGMWRATNEDDAPLSQEEYLEIERVKRENRRVPRVRYT
jgi:hypothetical protein